MFNVDIIIPTYKPGKELLTLLDRLCEQTLLPKKIIIMNTEKSEFSKNFTDEELKNRYNNVEIIISHISKNEFDHGGTRRKAVEEYSTSELFLCMTQDAIPADRTFLLELSRVFEKDENVAAAYARQLPRHDCSPEELYARKFNYSVSPIRKTKKDIPVLGIKTFFCSNVSAMYRRQIYDKLGGFLKKAIFNEDMVYAGNAIKADYAICYVPTAGVVHSHNYSCSQQFHRNFDNGVSQAMHPEVFANIVSESEGMKMLKGTVRYLQDIHKSYRIPYYILSVSSRYLGFRLGKMYKVLPKWFVKKCSLNKNFWNNR